MMQCCQVSIVVVILPMKLRQLYRAVRCYSGPCHPITYLQKVDRVALHSVQALLDGSLDKLPSGFGRPESTPFSRPKDSLIWG